LLTREITVGAIARGAPSSGPKLQARREQAEARADRFKRALGIQATRSGWPAAEVEKRKAELVDGLVLDRKSVERGGATDVIQAAIERLLT
jgi:hypothetical protein